MSSSNFNRRDTLKLLGATAGALLMPNVKASPVKDDTKYPFTFCLNMATIRGQQLGFIKDLEVAAAAGYGSVEIWIDTLQQYLKSGGTIKDARKRIADLGLKIENCIAFDEWVIDDEAARKAGMAGMKSTMEMLAMLGCKRITATGKGLDSNTNISLDTIAERYRAVTDMSASTGIIPILEMWGFQKHFSTVSEVTYSIMQAGSARGKILLDVFHIYKGKTPIDTLSFINPEINDILHMNDYPATISADVITDADRIYPGDGVAPYKKIFNALKKKDEPLILSAELFNKNYYSQDALTVAKTALSKMKAVVEGA